MAARCRSITCTRITWGHRGRSRITPPIMVYGGAGTQIRLEAFSRIRTPRASAHSSTTCDSWVSTIDSETGLFQNFRDYDPAVGRYVESDPVGLRGGVNGYSYSIENPVDFSDPYGLSPASLIFQMLSGTDDCKPSEWSYCTAHCAPARALGCYVTVGWKLKGIRGGEPIRSEQRTVNCNCEELDNCPTATPKKAKRGVATSSSSLTLPPWWWTPIPAVP